MSTTTPAGGMAPVFIQIIQGRASDTEALRVEYERSIGRLADQAEGWLGSTAGLTDEGAFFAAVRFASGEAARRASRQAEHEAWWQELTTVADGEASVHECSDVAEFAGGVAATAGFVEVIQGRAVDLGDILHRVAMAESSALPHQPVLLGGYIAAHDRADGFTQLMYYPSEQAARERTSEEVRETELLQVETMSEFVTDVRRFAIPDPWLHHV